MTVLVATPARLSTPKVLLDRVSGLVRSLESPGGLEWRLHLNEQASGGGHYGPNARARNELIDRYLKPWHEWVLWVDADIVEMPSHLLRALMQTSREWKFGEYPAVVAPMVWVERLNGGPVGFTNGGWFYDIGAFIDEGGEHADFHQGVKGEGDEIAMRSVGTCYLAPASLYRMGFRYRPVGDEVEHLSFMRQARAVGANVVATRRVEVIHAYLPKYGESWHHKRTEAA